MITIIDYGLGNLASISNALNKLKIPNQVSGDVEVLKKATVLILPGVGAAGQGMANLKELRIDKIIIQNFKKGTPILGICLGMQLLLSSSEEGDIKCLELITGNVKKFNTNLKVPQIGWNQVENTGGSSLLQKIKNNNYFYFVNSFYCAPKDKKIIKGVSEYGMEFCSIFEKDNLYGVQFHPEKSGDAGLRLLKNFWEASC